LKWQDLFQIIFASLFKDFIALGFPKSRMEGEDDTDPDYSEVLRSLQMKRYLKTDTCQMKEILFKSRIHQKITIVMLM